MVGFTADLFLRVPMVDVVVGEAVAGAVVGQPDALRSGLGG